MMPKLTHTEACKMVEDALERVGKTLAYIRLRLAETPNYMDLSGREMKVKGSVNEANVLCNINFYGAYLQGARAMLRAMQEQRLLNLPTVKGTKKSDAIKPTEKHTVKALIGLINESARNLEWFLHGWPENVEIIIRDETDAKGKVIGKKAMFMKKETRYKEI